MEYEDLYQFPKDHPPSPFGAPPRIIVEDNYENLIYLKNEYTLLAVGWLGKTPFKTGTIPDKLFQVLQQIIEGPYLEDGEFGYHSCEICGESGHNDIIAHGHYLLVHSMKVYMFPRFILHYIDSHDYLPPQEFLDALTTGHLAGEEELIVERRKLF